MISFLPYRQLLRQPGLQATIAASLIGRLPIGITGLAVLLLVQAGRGSFVEGGISAACYVSGLAVVAPLLGRIIDRHGPRTTLLITAFAFPAALVALVAAATRGAPFWAVLSTAAAAGAVFPPITVCIRTYFRQRLTDEELITTAFSLESVLIEIIFILGPMLVALFVAIASPAAAVWFAAACGIAGTLLFLRSPALRGWRIEPRSAPSLRGPLAERGFLPLIAVVLCFSSAFGLLEIGIAAYATEAGSPAMAGLLLGLMSLGSAFGGLAYGSRSWRVPLATQFALTLVLMAAGLFLLALPSQAWLFALVCILAGTVMAPALIMQNMLVAKAVRAEHLTEAFTWSASALLAGVGLGFAAGGGLLEVFQSSAVFISAAGSALLAAFGARLALGGLAR
jgi:MFS family permease